VFIGTFDEYLAWVVPGSPQYRNAARARAECDRAAGRRGACRNQVISTTGSNRTEERDTIIGGRYLDRMEKRGGEWRIAQRTMLYTVPGFRVSIDWSKGVMGLPSLPGIIR